MTDQEQKTFRVTVKRTVTYTNDVYVDADSEEEATEVLEARIREDDFGWFDRASWGEAFYYGVEKSQPDPDEFSIIEVEEA